MKKIRLFALPCLSLLLISLLSGCAGVSRVPLDKNVAAKISATEGKLSITNDEVIVRAQPSTISRYTGGGLIPALIDASVSKSRQSELEKLTGPFYEQVDGVDFRALFSEQFSRTLDVKSQVPNLALKVSTTGISKTEIEEWRAKLKAGEAFLGVRVFYEFTPDLRTLIVVANSQLVNAQGTTPIYSNSFIYNSAPVADTAPLEGWAKDQGRALAEVFKESGIEIAKMLKLDMEAPSNEILANNRTKQEKVKVQIPYFAPFVMSPNGALIPLTAEGVVEASTESRKIVRAEGGALFSVQK
jgi:hypothetical protein